MKKIALVLLVMVVLAACQPAGQAAQSGGAKTALKVIAAETFLADIAQNVAGDRVKIEALMPIGVDPHSFRADSGRCGQRSPTAMCSLSTARAWKSFSMKLLKNAGGQHQSH